MCATHVSANFHTLLPLKLEPSSANFFVLIAEVITSALPEMVRSMMIQSTVGLKADRFVWREFHFPLYSGGHDLRLHHAL